jgi:hypothetical protein
VSECDREASIMRRPWPTGGCCAMGTKLLRIPKCKSYYNSKLTLDKEMLKYGLGSVSIKYVCCDHCNELPVSIRKNHDEKCGSTKW